jgi:hypothetical protein
VIKAARTERVRAQPADRDGAVESDYASAAAATRSVAAPAVSTRPGPGS